MGTTISADGRTVYVAYAADTKGGNLIGGLAAVDAANGAIKWHVGFGNTKGAQSPPLESADGSTIYQSILGCSILAINAKDGTTKWRYGICVGETPTLSLDGRTLFFGKEAQSQWTTDPQRGVLALNTDDGSVKWHFLSEREGAFGVLGYFSYAYTPALSLDGRVLYLTSTLPDTNSQGEGRFSALNAENGTLLPFAASTTASTSNTAPALSLDGKTAYVADSQSKVHALDTCDSYGLEQPTRPACCCCC